MQRESINFDDTATAFAYRNDDELRKSNLVFSTMKFPWVVKLGTYFTSLALKIHLPVKGIIKKTLFNQFCGGESIRDCQSTIDMLGRYNVKTILDYSVEGMENEAAYDEALLEALRVVDFAKGSPHIPFVVMKVSGFGNTQLMTKYQEGIRLTEEETKKLNDVKLRVEQIVSKASMMGLMVMLDAEESWFQQFIDEMAYELMEKYNTDRPVVFNTYQMYRHDKMGSLEEALSEAKGKYHLGVKLVRGAYMEKERDRAHEKGYPSPVHQNKEGVDQDYNEALRICIENIERVGLCAGTHNEESAAYLTQLMESKGLKKTDQRIYFAQLLGMSDNISFTLSTLGYNVAKYVPYGPVEKVLPYLFRRAEENTSIAGQSGRQLNLVKKELKRRKSKL